MPESAQDHPAPRWLWPGVLLALALAAVVLVARPARRVVRCARRGLRPLLERAAPTGTQRGLRRHWRLRRLRRDVERSCRSSDPAALEQALYRYLACWYRSTPTRAAALFRDAGAGPLLDRLQAARFGSGSHEPPATAAVLAALMQLRPAPATSRDPLPELYERA
jgi:hypothetical protein